MDRNFVTTDEEAENKSTNPAGLHNFCLEEWTESETQNV